MSIFGALAVVLAAIGIYGVIGYTLTRRTREIGIRLALGEDPSRIKRLIMCQGMLIVVVSLAVGAPAAMVVARMIEGLLYDVTPTDPTTYLVAGAVLGAVGLIACYVPARRVVRITPLLALRAEP